MKVQKKPVKREKVKTRRSENKLRAFDPTLNLKSRYEEIVDIASYAHTLSPKDQKWLAAFTEEYVNANFNHGGKKIHKTKKLKKSIYDRNNARNRDIYTKSKAQGILTSLDAVYSGIKDKDDEETVPVVKEKKLK